MKGGSQRWRRWGRGMAGIGVGVERNGHYNPPKFIRSRRTLRI